ncbi:MAG TPA: ABC transporter permease [Gemmatimonadota bacterium]|nr:ABC transporter permease [Gemmatimonadota bacterium]
MNAPSTTRPFYWSVRRELWENRSLWIAPLVVATLATLAFFVTLPGLPESVRALSGPDMSDAHMTVHGPYGGAALLGFATAFVVAVFYCLGALQGERRDRSILFWKSLPISDRTTVLAKASIPFIVLPLLVFGFTAIAFVVMMLVGTTVVAATGASAGMLWSHAEPFQSGVSVLYAVFAITLWHAPIYGWLLLVSSWARRTAFLWAVLPFVAIAGVERILFGTTRFALFLNDLLLGWVDRAFVFENDAMGDMLGALTPVTFLRTPSLWIGLAFTAACLTVAVHMRRYREPN